MNQLDMKGRNVIVTGGASGIGLAICRRLVQSGANVSIWDINEKAMADAARSLDAPKTHTAAVDVSKLGSVEAAFVSTLTAFDKIDALVNSAGIAGVNATVWEYPVDEWLRVHDIDLHGIFYTCRTVVPHMIRNGYGRIVNIASVAGKEGNPNACAYSSSKAAVIALTKTLGKELATKRRHRELRSSGGGADPAFRRIHPIPHRFHALQDPDGTFRSGRRNRRNRRLGMHRGVFVHDGGDIRSLRRTGNVLISPVLRRS